jgi:hypothetical protein
VKRLSGRLVNSDERASVYSFCTYFDANYLTRGIALYESLKAFHDMRLWVLCMDSASHAHLTKLALPGIELIALSNLETYYPALLAAKANRSPIEYYFTCTPALPLYVMAHHPEVEQLTYLDADLYFYSSAQPLFDEIGSRSIAIFGHRFSPKCADRITFGKYNVGWLSFRRDEQGLACLNLWHRQCLAWCYDRLDEGRFADQKYLDDWPTRYDNLVVVGHKGGNLATWNIDNYALKVERGRILVDSDPLIFFHFHGLKQLTERIFDTGISEGGVVMSPLLRRFVVAPYVDALQVARARLARLGITLSAPSIRRRWHPFFAIRWYQKARDVASIVKRHLLYRTLFLAPPRKDT